MALAHSKITAQGQISVPADVRRNEEGEKLVVRRALKFSSEEIHRTLFPEGPPKRATIEDMKEAIRGYVKNRLRRGGARRSSSVE
jgi:bifunctional DNA-binding transcriptional regulator/antitoxin component of YhaV-PrlF toxin-antitoxin module